MEKNNIVVGKHCMEYSDIIFSLRNIYNLITTDLSADDSVCLYPGYISVISLSPDQMQQLVSFFHTNHSLQQIGFSESSLLFLAKSRKIKVAIMDTITQKICDELGIETIKIERRKTEISESTVLMTDVRTSRLSSAFRIAACL
ncbi:MAG: hypothetical protein K2M87_01550 [Muribaculaceae bacterium]|nr:hypothetical protein [Muribaculaceae bacterium]